MAWYNSTGKENDKSVFENISHDRCIMCNSDRTEIARTDFTIMFSEFEYNTGSICKKFLKSMNGCQNNSTIFIELSYTNFFFPFI